VTATPLIAEAALPDNLQRGLRAVRDRVCATARAIASDANFTIIAIGRMTKASTGGVAMDADVGVLPDEYVENAAELFARVANTFPHALPYGVITVPFLHRRDGRAIDWQHMHNANAHAVSTALGRADVGFWSWDWRNMRQVEPEDLVALVEWARKCVREGAR
jgi:hypothetical protein